MSFLIPAILRAAETWPLPDALLRAGSDVLVWATDLEMRRKTPDYLRDFIAEMEAHPIARDVAAANAQHYELPPAFFAHFLGRYRKYSCGYFASPQTRLDDGEEAALSRTVEFADIRDGHSILELGCGWGSLTLYMAQRFPGASIVAVSNSAPQRAHIEEEAARRGLSNIRVVTADINTFAPESPVDRIVSVEMFEHLSNWTEMSRRMHGWLSAQGRVYLHIFNHAEMPYRFDETDPDDWIAQHFFTGGIMPSHGLLAQLDIPFEIEVETRWDGRHYARTAREWLKRFDADLPAIKQTLAPVYGPDLPVWIKRWRLFFIATERLFGYRGGTLWAVSHYRLRPLTDASARQP